MTVILIAIIIGVVGLDQLTKWLTVVNLDLHETFPLWQDVFHFTHERNTGMAFGMLKDHRWVFMVFSTVAIVALLVYLFRFRPESRWMQVSMAFIVGGGIGNMIDRVFLGYVVDFFDFRLINFAVFNVADSFVCIGAGMMIAYLLVDLIREIRLERAKKAAGEEKNDTNVE
ncbi:MAG: signal peptidase II, partial [Clostridia bacterium]|nr:signal peptidase II [Clostridia bacterium]